MGTESDNKPGGSPWHLWHKSEGKAKGGQKRMTVSSNEEPGSGEKQSPTTNEKIRKGIYLSALIYIEGDQAPADNFNALAKAALQDRLSGTHNPAHDALKMTLKKAEEQTDVEEDDSRGGQSNKAQPKSGKKEEKFEF